MTEIKHVSQSTFQEEVLQSPVPVLVDFTAVWCGPCKMIEPVVKQLADQWSGKAKIFKLDVDQEPELANAYQVMSVPTLMLFVSGRPVERVTGYMPRDRLEKKFSPYLK